MAAGAGPRRMRSSTVILGGMGVLATALAACGSDPDKRCVDRDDYTFDGYKIVDSKYCGSSSSAKGKKRGSGSKSRVDGAWYYDAETDRGRADYGTFSRSEAVDRGGFGCDDSGSGGG
ncbi:hypothetical protein [Streptomyces indicus]|uniref:Lipoprotein n=1 Tax=Streptomyces indicus TaxID=417292 RepID=A0A1G9EH69_9ACTN|nr:hypothetical protein [Streptomyces indicus]SDK75385.1 hypothetical protein SAMN05421806_111163 [Streptomyces indicus]